ncbi:hypothetical protein MXD81_05395 [Microbacteriaceae bacterium K1510]|nr:hypothetical protein [Microbacteriaceae bacterium K1510]
MPHMRDAGNARPTIPSPRFGRLPLNRPKPFGERFRALTLPLTVFAILAIAALSVRLAIWLLTLH